MPAPPRVREVGSQRTRPRHGRADRGRGARDQLQPPRRARARHHVVAGRQGDRRRPGPARSRPGCSACRGADQPVRRSSSSALELRVGQRSEVPRGLQHHVVGAVQVAAGGDVRVPERVRRGDPVVHLDLGGQRQDRRVGRHERPHRPHGDPARVDRPRERRVDGHHRGDPPVRVVLQHRELAHQAALAVRDQDDVAQVVLVEVLAEHLRRVRDGSPVVPEGRERVHPDPVRVAASRRPAAGTATAPTRPAARHDRRSDGPLRLLVGSRPTRAGCRICQRSTLA